MRFVFYGAFLVFWFGMWWWTYTCHIKTSCCPDGIGQEPVSLIEIDSEDPRPVVFRWSEVQPVATPAFDAMRDSLVTEMRDGDVLEITGLYYRDEEPVAGGQDLGLARAMAMRDILAPHVPADRIQVRSEIANLTGDVRKKFFNALEYRFLVNNAYVREIEDRALIYFPFNSTKPELSQEIHDYLDAVAQRLGRTGERVILTGHTDDEGSDQSNYYLGHWRASAIRDALVSKGIDPEKITVESKGELEPIASNGTREGRERNRRVEMQLFQQN